MADKKISELGALDAATRAATDVLPIVDVSAGETKKITVGQLFTDPVVDGGTANGVAYLNGSKVLTTGSALTFDGTGLSVTGSTSATLKLNGRASDNASSVNFYNNTGATRYGFIYFDASNAQIASANTNPLAFLLNGSEQMRLTSTGLGIGTSSPAYKLDVRTASGDIEAQIKADGASSAANLRLVGSVAGYNNIRSMTGATEEWKIGSGALAGTMTFSTGGTLRATLDSSGNLGLGVTPSAWANYKAIDVGIAGSISSYNYTDQLRVDIVSNGYATGAGSYYYKNNGTAGAYYINNGAHYWSVAPSGTAGNAISFSQSMTLDASGRLGIGITSPNFILDVAGDSEQQAEFTRTGTTTGASYARFVNSGGSMYIGVDSSIGGRITNATTPYAAAITTSNATPLIFGTNNTERARIDSSGNLLVGTTSFVGNYNGFSVSPGNAFSIFGHASGVASGVAYTQFYYGGAAIGSITQNGTTAILYNTTSDYRLKNVIGAVTGAGERIDALKPVEYEWKADGSRTRGFLAHEFQEVYAGSVTGTKDAVDADGNPEYQAMQAGSSEVIADLVAEIKSLRARLTAAGL